MKVKTKRLTRNLISLAAMLGLMVSSVGACMCSHHVEESQPTHSCHQEANTHQSEAAEKIISPAFNETCICLPSPTKLSVKSEGFKLKKQPAFFGASVSLPAGRFHSSHVRDVSSEALSPRWIQFPRSISSRGPPAS